MRLGSLRTDHGLRVVAEMPQGWLDLGRAASLEGDVARDLAAFIAAGEDTWQRARAAIATATENNGQGEIVYPEDPSRLGPPVASPVHVFCIGQNYRAHVLEQGLELPKLPEIFLRTATTLVGPRDNIWYPGATGQLDLEVELAVVIGKGGRHIPKERALDAVFGYMVLNDVSARDLQFRASQWTVGKNCDHTAPCGPFVVTRDELPDPPILPLGSDIGGEPMQASHTGDLIFDLPTLIADLSSFATLLPGDVIATGTPGGVGMFRTPPRWLKVGDTIHCWVDGVGELVNRVVEEPSA